jgi:hypothetical protein
MSTLKTLTKPILTPILGERWLPLLFAGVGVVQVGMLATLGHGWPCPVKAALGIPCPGCGLSTATLQLLQGKWKESLTTHAFAPLFLFGLIVITAILQAVTGAAAVTAQ